MALIRFPKSSPGLRATVEDFRLGQLLLRRDPDRLTVQMSSPAGVGGKGFTADRVMQHPQHRPAFFHQRHAHHKMGHALDKLLGAVQRVHHPYPVLIQPLIGVGGLLGKPAVIGIGLP